MCVGCGFVGRAEVGGFLEDIEGGGVGVGVGGHCRLRGGLWAVVGVGGGGSRWLHGVFCGGNDRVVVNMYRTHHITFHPLTTLREGKG